MLRRIHVQNFKSIADLTMEAGRVNVLIGENGCGKSNFLEALAFASAAEADKLDNEFLTSRGIRVTGPEFMRSAFKDEPWESIAFDLSNNEGHQIKLKCASELDSHYPRWLTQKEHIDKASEDNQSNVSPGDLDALIFVLKKLNPEKAFSLDSEAFRASALRTMSRDYFREQKSTNFLTAFIVYSPENSALRTFIQEGQVLPLGIKGEGLFKLLRFLSTDEERWKELKFNLKMSDWFRDLAIAPEQAPFEQTLQIYDRFVAKELLHFDQRSANEGFLFLLFYTSLVISPDTPSIFAIDNIDASLNPKTATVLTARLAKLAKKYNKQIFLTTHSPAVLDGLDLTDPEHRLFVFQRNRKGETRCRRVEAPQPVAGEIPVKLSEAFLRGLIGGLPQNF